MALLSSSGPAPLAQSAERLHGKEKVDSSILSGGSVRVTGPCPGGVAQGQSRRLIIAESVVQVHPPLPPTSPHPGEGFSDGSLIGTGLPAPGIEEPGVKF